MQLAGLLAATHASMPYDYPMDHVAALFVVGLAGALLGWGLIVIASRMERERQERHGARFGEPQRPLPQWAQIVRSWLMP